MSKILTTTPTEDSQAAVHGLVANIDAFRTDAFGRSSAEQRSRLGQFPTPLAIARRMASMFMASADSIRILDAGAGVGSLTAAVVADLSGRRKKPNRIEAVAFEIDSDLARYLSKSLTLCGQSCEVAAINFKGHPRNQDFIQAAVEMLEGGLFGSPVEHFNCAILNPPYKKINTESEHRRLLRTVGIETSNLYTAFLALAILLLEPGGELVAITPRSFCNGPYFKPFRQLLLREMSLRQIHVFESRSDVFSDDEILQENIIIHAVKTTARATEVLITSSRKTDGEPSSHSVAFNALIKPDDPDQFIHIVADEAGREVADLMGKLVHSLGDLGLSVSTGRVVDFRSRSFLRSDPGSNTVPLIYPTHFSEGWIAWPKLGHKKPNACVVNDESRPWLIQAAVHVLVKRFSAKEEKRRVVASIFDPAHVPCDLVAFENHLNYYHENGRGVSPALARGLTAFLNSTLVDTYFRQFNGHTQVNAADLRNLKYPSRAELEDLGTKVGNTFPTQIDLDHLVEEELMAWRKPE